MPGMVDAQLAMYQGATILAQAEPEPPEGAEFGKASPIGIPVVLILLIITVALVWNMNSRIKKLPESFDPDEPEADQLVDEGTDRSGVAAAAGEDSVGAIDNDVNSAGSGNAADVDQPPLADDGGDPSAPDGR